MNEQHFMTKTLSVRSSLAQGLKAKTLPKVKLHATSSWYAKNAAWLPR